MRYYIAYGSNLNIRQMRFRCPTARIAGTADLDGWRLLFRGSKTGSYLTIEPAEGYSVPVGVWEVTPKDERALDRYEGFPTFYYKRELRIALNDAHSGEIYMVDAFVYIMHEDRPLGTPTQAYLSVCGEGYRNFGFEYSPLLRAINESKETA